MKLLIFIIFSLFTLSCSKHNSETQVFIFGDTYFNLHDGEKLVELNKEQTELYFSYIKNVDLQAPLYKQITAEGYKIYIGLPINTSLIKLKKSELNDDFSDNKLRTDEKNYLYNTYQKENETITKYFYENEGNIVLLLVVDSSDSTSRFDYNSVSKRFTDD